jgi:hypothetical protein
VVHSYLALDAARDDRRLELVVQLQFHTLMHTYAYGDIPKQYHVLRYPAKPGQS